MVIGLIEYSYISDKVNLVMDQHELSLVKISQNGFQQIGDRSIKFRQNKSRPNDQTSESCFNIFLKERPWQMTSSKAESEKLNITSDWRCFVTRF